jgi:hypothetical protein
MMIPAAPDRASAAKTGVPKAISKKIIATAIYGAKLGSIVFP